MNLADLSNEEVLTRLHTLVGEGRTVLARLLAYLGEVEERRLDLQSACSSLFEFCVRRLALSEDEACRRVAAARLVRRFPVALAMIERGEIHLTGLLMLRDYLTREHGEELLRAAAGKTKREVQHLIAERFPRPDTPSRLQVLTGPTAQAMEKVTPDALPSSALRPGRSCTEPLAPARYRVEFTASAELEEKLRHAADLMRHSNPSGDLSVVVERALDLLLAKLEKQRLAKVRRACDVRRTSTRRGYVSRAVRREVFERDGESCTFVDGRGRRCEARTLLELDHIVPRAEGGPDDASNLTVRCRSHNRLSAEQHFGREHMARCSRKRRFVGESFYGGEGGGGAAYMTLRVDDSRAPQAVDEDAIPTAEAAQQHAGRPSARESWPSAGEGSRNRPSRPATRASAATASSPSAATASSPQDPSQRGYEELVFRALCGMGFRGRDSRRALGVVARQGATSPPASIESLLRRALAVLA
jgi:5-methylcytosine-specific restriction endonuclease McrA